MGALTNIQEGPKLEINMSFLKFLIFLFIIFSVFLLILIEELIYAG